jgi:1-deoxyxylulose-5-phosphate synthase
VDAGIIFFDTADTYSDGVSEKITGRLLRKLFSRRDDYVLATKAYYPTGPGPPGAPVRCRYPGRGDDGRAG